MSMPMRLSVFHRLQTVRGLPIRKNASASHLLSRADSWSMLWVIAKPKIDVTHSIAADLARQPGIHEGSSHGHTIQLVFRGHSSSAMTHARADTGCPLETRHGPRERSRLEEGNRPTNQHA